MKKLILFLLFLTFCSAANADITTGLVGWWKFDEANSGACSGASVLDSSGNGYTATCNSSPTYVAGEIGKGALSFNGTSQYLSVGNIGNVQTISYWIKSNNQANSGIELNSNQYIDDNAVPEGMDYNGITSTVYVDGVVKTLYGSQLVVNGNMESSSAGWTGQSESCISTSCAQSSTVAHSGTNSWKVVSAGSYAGAGQPITWATSTLYKGTGWFYTGSGVSGYISLQSSFGTGFANVLPSAATAAWTFGYVYGTSASSNSLPYIIMYSLNGAATDYFDDVSAEPVLIRYPITDSNWHLVVITISSAMSASAFNIGLTPTNGTNVYFNGKFDDVRVYNRALSAADVAQLYSYTGKSGGFFALGR